MSKQARRFLTTIAAAKIAAALLLAGCGGGDSSGSGSKASDSGLTKVSLQADWLAVVEQAGFFQAMGKGYYADEGLDMTIHQGGPNHPSVLAMVARNESQFGLDELSGVVQANEEGLGLQMVFAFTRQSPLSLLSRKDVVIEDFADLEGKTVMANPGAAWLAWARHLGEADFEVVPIQPTLVRFLQDDSGDFVQQAFITNEPYYLEQQGVPVNVLPFADLGFSNWRGVFVAQRWAENNPEAVEAFVRASIRGWIDYLTVGPEPADSIVFDRNPELVPDYRAFTRAQLYRYDILHGKTQPLYEYGRNSIDGANRLLDIFADIGLLDERPPLDTFVTNEYLPDTAWFAETFPDIDTRAPIPWLQAYIDGNPNPEAQP